MRQKLIGMAAVLGLVGTALAPASPAAAALPTCTRAANMVGESGLWLWEVPLTGGKSTNCELNQGDTGDGVEALQWVLNICYKRTEVNADGQFGSITANALRAAQRTAGTPADGIFGPNTRKKFKFRSNGGSGPCSPWTLSPWYWYEWD
ncbi:peptidoglycan-binding protein [Actinoplanes sp. NBC_00393]|uniref:peptidoglycan-binding domain-containing protein n=1 Tax=Actinoplanes sp. NBC_00393 TaxID=2975953 RepID=UPI002E1D1C95